MGSTKSHTDRVTLSAFFNFNPGINKEFLAHFVEL